MASLSGLRVAIVGLGAIGGSLAQALHRAGIDIRGFTTSDADALAARASTLVVVRDLRTCVESAAIVVIAVPLDAHRAVTTAVADAAPPEAILLHAAGLQRPHAVGSVRRVVGTHPLAGTHRSGFVASSPELFRDCVVSIEARADASTRSHAEALWRIAGARRCDYRSADEHDRLMAWISHLPQLVSTALSACLADAGLTASALGPGGRDVTRLAASPFDMWRPLLEASRPDVAAAAAQFEQTVNAVRIALEQGDVAALERVWSSGREWRTAQ